MTENLNLISENLAELLTNTVDMAAVFYDIFLNPNPMYVDLKMYDDNNELITVTIPNRAQDREDAALSGIGSPEGVKEAPVGTAYVDTASSTVYYKVSGSDQFGWSAVISQSYMEAFIRNYLEARGYLTTANFNTRLYNNVTSGEIITSGESRSIKATSGNYGVVQLDGESIIPVENTEEQTTKISVAGIMNNNENDEAPIKKLWIGEESEYETLTPDENTIYVLTDTGKVIVGNMKVANSSFPSSQRETSTYVLGTSGETYTAPTDGWFLLDVTAGVADSHVNIINNISGYTQTLWLPTTTATGTVVCPTLKGETVTITYDVTGGTNRFWFINAAASRMEQ